MGILATLNGKSTFIILNKRVSQESGRINVIKQIYFVPFFVLSFKPTYFKNLKEFTIHNSQGVNSISRTPF
jgi:hypothetical protein